MGSKMVGMMNFRKCIKQNEKILMEGALGERLKREYRLTFDEYIAMATLLYDKQGAQALTNLWNEYIDIARRYQLPFLAMTPTRRANYERVTCTGGSEQIIMWTCCGTYRKTAELKCT